MGFNDTVKRVVNETASAAYSATMRMVSTEASANAHANDACFKDFQLIEIPHVMETRMNAPVGAALMRRWFNGQPHVLSDAMRTSNVDYRMMPRHTVDTATVKMGWAARFARTRDALAALETRRVNTPAAGRELKRVLMRANLLNKRCYQIGTSREAITLHETVHLNSIVVALSGSADPLDCALGTYTLHMAITGTVQPLRKRMNNVSHEVEITHLHFYIRDNYDFTGDAEPLGHWGRDGASHLPSNGKSFVENRSFREWRARHGRGGDFVVFSDVMTKQLARPAEIFIQIDPMRRILSLIFLLPLGVLTVFCFIGYANVVDTMSMKMGSFFMYQVFFWIACGGTASLFICQGLHLFAARWILIVSLLICAGFTVFSIAAYPGNHDDPHVPLALSHSPGELHILLIATTLLLMAAIFESRVRELAAKIVR